MDWSLKVFSANPSDSDIFSTNNMAAMDAVDAMAAKLPRTDHNQFYIDNLKASLTHLIDTGKQPNCLLKLMATGAFKETYRIPGIHSWVIKFFTNENETNHEEEILQAAEEEGLAPLFVPTIFCHFANMAIQPSVLEGDVDPDASSSEFRDCDEFGPVYLTGFELQPFCERISCSAGEHYFCMSNYNKYPLYDENGERFSYTYLTDTVDCYEWTYYAIEYYGASVIPQLHDFIHGYGVYDLHSENIGYLRDDEGDLRPVILDWLSDGGRPDNCCWIPIPSNEFQDI